MGGDLVYVRPQSFEIAFNQHGSSIYSESRGSWGGDAHSPGVMMISRSPGKCPGMCVSLEASGIGGWSVRGDVGQDQRRGDRWLFFSPAQTGAEFGPAALQRARIISPALSSPPAATSEYPLA
jgi:hypothetical protein